MSGRLERLLEHFKAERFDMMASEYDNYKHESELQNIEASHKLKLAKAFFILERWSDCKEICNKIYLKEYPEIYYESSILIVKCNYFLGVNDDRFLNDLMKYIKSRVKDQFSNDHVETLEEIARTIFLRNEGPIDYDPEEFNTFNRILTNFENEGPLSEGFPMFLISISWLKKWELFCQRKSSISPGPITQFDLCDHLYNAYRQKSSEKAWQNYFIFKFDKCMAIPLEGWKFLVKRYQGIPIKRFNISQSERPKEIFTEIYLKKLEIKIDLRGKKPNILILQLSRKSTIDYLKQTLSRLIPNQAQLMVREGNGQKFQFLKGEITLEEADFMNAVLVYTDNYGPTEKAFSEKCGRLECKNSNGLKFCKCKTIKYCSLECLKECYGKHRFKCEQEIERTKNLEGFHRNIKFEDESFKGNMGIVGLKNLGNTCYMNAGFQCLSNTEDLTKYFMSQKFVEHINFENNLGTRGELALSYAEAIRAMWAGTGGAVSLFKLKRAISDFAVQFSGFGQQDSQEFISYLIDGLQEDLNLVREKENFEIDDDETIPDQIASEKSERNYSKRIQSYIRDLMVGQFKSTVRCLKCGRVSVCFDPYMCISLPLPTLMRIEIFIVNYEPTQLAEQFLVFFQPRFLLRDLRTYLEKELQTGEKLRFYYLEKQRFEILEEISDETSLSTIFSYADKTYFFCYIFPASAKNALRIEFCDQKSSFGYPRFILDCTAEDNDKILKFTNKMLSRKNSFGHSVFNYEPQEDTPTKVIETNKKGEQYVRLIFRREFCLNKYSQNPNSSINFHEEVRLEHCLQAFTNIERLENENAWYCKTCKSHQSAQKQMEIYKSSKYLMLAFKRFSRIRKNSERVVFPIEGLNMGPYLKSNENGNPIIYDLYGVINHYGGMHAGHYTAFCRNFLNKQWYEFDDSRVSAISEKAIMGESAYVLFYKKRI